MVELTQIDPRTISGEEVDDLWSKVSSQDYYLSDLSRGRPDQFVMDLFRPNALHFKAGGWGLITLKDVIVGINADIHFALWDKPPMKEVLETADELLRALFTGSLELARVTACIPEYNKEAQHLVSFLNFRLEGIIRSYMPKDGKLVDMHIYGLLKEEFLGGKS